MTGACVYYDLDLPQLARLSSRLVAVSWSVEMPFGGEVEAARSGMKAEEFAGKRVNPYRMRHFGIRRAFAGGLWADLRPRRRAQGDVALSQDHVQDRARMRRLWARTVTPTVET